MVKTTANSSPSSSSSTTSEQHHQQASEPKYTGVRKRKWGKWVSEIRLPNSRERIWLGSYDTPEKAARAFDAALYCLRGPTAKFNFPRNPPRIAGGESLSPQQIQVAAARFANEVTSTTTSNSNNNGSTSIISTPDASSQVTGQYYASASSTSDGAIQAGSVNHHSEMDWSFLNTLDLNGSVSDYGYYQDEYYPPPPPPPSIFDDDDYRDNNVDHDDDDYGNEAYSHPSFLWNF